MRTEYDIIVVGAGLVGASLAVALQMSSFKIALLEKQLPDILMNTNADARPISLAYGSQLTLERWGIWKALASQAGPIKTVHVSEQRAFGTTHFCSEDYQIPALGYVVPFAQLQKALYRQLNAQDNITFIPIESLESIQLQHDSAIVTMKVEKELQTLQARYLVGADGAQSTVRQLLNIGTKEQDHQEQALIANVKLSEHHQQVAYERFTREGILALLPLLNRRQYRLVWALDKAKAGRVKAWTGQEWQMFLKEQFKQRIPNMTDIEIQNTFPLKTITAEQQIKQQAILIGNAAHTVYPLAAQGFNLSLRDVVVLSDVIERQKSLTEYLRFRKTDQRFIKNSTRALVDLFGLQWPMTRTMLGLGLLALDMVSPLKKRLAKQFMGV